MCRAIVHKPVFDPFSSFEQKIAMCMRMHTQVHHAMVPETSHTYLENQLYLYFNVDEVIVGFIGYS